MQVTSLNLDLSLHWALKDGDVSFKALFMDLTIPSEVSAAQRDAMTFSAPTER